MTDAGQVDGRHAQLLADREHFRIVMDIDGKGFGIALSALNKDSLVALLQVTMVVNRSRITGYVVRREGGELVASVQAADYVKQMTENTVLKSPPAPREGPAERLRFWDLVQVKPKEPMTDEAAKMFTFEAVIDGAMEKFTVSGPTKESMIALFTAATCEKMPRISGWNLYDDGGKLLASVPAVEFLAMLAEKTPLSKLPANPKDAGWRAMPAIIPTTEEFQEAMKAAKKEGRIPK